MNFTKIDIRITGPAAQISDAKTFKDDYVWFFQKVQAGPNDSALTFTFVIPTTDLAKALAEVSNSFSLETLKEICPDVQASIAKSNK